MIRDGEETMDVEKSVSRLQILLQLNRMNGEATDLVLGGFIEEAESMLADCIALGLQHMHRTSEFQDSPETKAFLAELPLQDALLSDDCFISDHVHEFGGFPLYSSLLGVYDDRIGNVRTMMAVVTYNLALLYHGMGIADRNQTYLLKAREIYQIAYTCLPTVTRLLQPPGHDNESAVLMRLAVINNIGHLSYLLEDVERVQTCRSIMHDHLALLKPTSGTWFRNSVAQAMSGTHASAA